MEKINSVGPIRRRLIYLAILFFLPFLNISYVYAGKITGVSGDAEAYRTKGYVAQQRGDIDTAIEWYQKAISLKPEYASPHNDIGILFETKGWLDRAEAEYEKAIAIDPNYKEVHTNLALLYERKGELEKAAFHWMRRYKLGDPNDPWTKEAKSRLEKLGLLDKAEDGISPKIEQQAPEVKKSQKKEKPKPNAISKARKYPNERKALAPKKKEINKELQESLRLAEEKLKKEKESKRSAREKVDATVNSEANVDYSKTKDSDWTRIGSEKKKEAVNVPASSKEINKELQESLRLAEEKLKKERGGKKSAEEKKVDAAVNSEANVVYSKTKDPNRTKIRSEKKKEDVKVQVSNKDVNKELQESLKLVKDINKELQEAQKLAQERLRKNRKNKRGAKEKVGMVINSEANVAYGKAKGYYNKGEYTKALDIIRIAKQDSKESKSLLELEEDIKFKMKEAKIEDHYKEGMIRYRQKDFAGTRKECEAILSILPE